MCDVLCMYSMRNFISHLYITFITCITLLRWTKIRMHDLTDNG